jgi:flagellar motor switch protein FliM
VALGERAGTLDLLLPLATLEPVRDRLRQRPEAGRTGNGPRWAEHLGREVRRASVEVVAVLEERTMGLREILGLAPGAVLHLRAGTGSPASLVHEGRAVASGRIGRSGERLSMRIETLAPEDEENEHG